MLQFLRENIDFFDIFPGSKTQFKPQFLVCKKLKNQ